MTKRKNLTSRRKFLNTGAALIGGGLIGGGFIFSGCSHRKDLRESLNWRVLTDQEAQIIDMICEQIIPADKDPGAHDAGVINYIDRQLAPGGRIEGSTDNYKKGLISLQESSRKLYGKSFSELIWDEQTQLLKALEVNKVDESHWQHQKASEFFSMIRQHTLEGFFGHPMYGGNKNLAGYRLVRHQYPEIRGQNRYTDQRFSRDINI